jgi:dCMP deaminase
LTREHWNEYFLKIAYQVATRSTCDRNNVGAVIVREKMILSTGYNGSIRGLSHCDEIGHLMENDHCVRTVHAEVNAIAQAARNGINLNNSELYVTSSPCWNCFKALANVGIKKIFFSHEYREKKIFEFAKLANIEMIQVMKQIPGET